MEPKTDSFLQFRRTFYHNPTNMGGWIYPLGVLLHYICSQLARHLGNDVGYHVLQQQDHVVAQSLAEVSPFVKEWLPWDEVADDEATE